MLNSRWNSPPCRNMYGTGCQSQSRSRTAPGISPRYTVMDGNSHPVRYAATLTMTMALMAGVRGPGPIEKDMDVGDDRRIYQTPTSVTRATTTASRTPDPGPPPVTRGRGINAGA